MLDKVSHLRCRPAVQVGEDGEDAAVVAGVLLEAELGKNDPDRALDGLRCDVEGFGNRAVRATLRDEGKNLLLPWRQASQPMAGPARTDQLVDDARIYRGPALGDAARRIRQLTRLAEAVFQQVAGAAGARTQQPERVVRLEVLRQDEYANAITEPCSDVECGDEAGIAAGRHPDVDDRQVRLLRLDQSEQLLGRPGLAHY